MEPLVRFFEISGNSLIIAIPNEESLKILNSYLIFEAKELPETDHFESSEIYSIKPKCIDGTIPIFVFCTFSDLTSLRMLIDFKHRLSESSFSEKKIIIMLFLPISDNPQINAQILDKVITLESEDQFSEIINMEYRESGQLKQRRMEELSKFQRISDLYLKMQTQAVNQREWFLRQFSEFKKESSPVLRLNFLYLNHLFDDITAGVFAPIETIPTICYEHVIYHGIPRNQSLDRFINKIIH